MNWAYYSGVSTNGGGDVGALASPGNWGGRWHQGRDATPDNPIYITFDLGENSAWIGYAQMYNVTDASGGLFNYHLEYLPAGMANAAGNWVVLDETLRTNRQTNDGDVFTFNQAVHASALRWVLTEGTQSNYRFSKFEFFTSNPSLLSLANAPGATLTWSNNPSVLGNDAVYAHNGNPQLRFESNYPGRQANENDPDGFGQQYLTLMLPEEYDLQWMRMLNEDYGSYIDLFSVEYLLADGLTWQTVPGLDNLTQQPNIAEYDLSMLPATTGLRLNIVNPSSQGHNILRLREFEVFGTPAIPEPATMVLLAMGGLALLRRRRA